MTTPIERPRYSPPPAAANVVPAETAGSDSVSPSTPNDGDWSQFVGGNPSGGSAAAAYPGLGSSKALSPASAKAAYQECAAMEGSLSDLLASMAATMATMFQKLRKNAVESQALDLKTQVQAMQGQAAKMRDAAEKNHTAAKWQGWSQFASGCVGVAGGAYSAYSAVKAGNALKAEQASRASADKTATKTPAADPAADTPTVDASKAQTTARTQEEKDMDELLAMEPRQHARVAKEKAAQDAADFDELMGSAPRERSNAFSGKSAGIPSEKSDAKSVEKPAAKEASEVNVAHQKDTASVPKTSSDVWNTRAQVTKTMAESLGQMATGFGSSIASNYKHDADLDEAQSKELDAQSTQAAAARAVDEEAGQMWKEAIQRLLDNFKALVDQEQASSKAIIQNI